MGKRFKQITKDDDRDLDYSFAVSTIIYMMAPPLAPRGVFENIQVFLLITNGLIEGLLLLLWISK